MNIELINTETDYHAVLKQIEPLMMARANMQEGKRLDVLVTQVEKYERKYYLLVDSMNGGQ